MRFDECLTALLPMARVRLEGNRLKPNFLLWVASIYGSSPLLLAYADLFAPGIVVEGGRVRLGWDGYEVELAEGASTDITELVGKLGPDSEPLEALAGVVAHFWTLGLRVGGFKGRFVSRPEGLVVAFEPLPGDTARSGDSGRGGARVSSPLAGVVRRVGAQAKQILHLAKSAEGAYLRELRALQGDAALIPSYGSLLAPTVDLSLGYSSVQSLYVDTAYHPFHVDILHGDTGYESDELVRAAGEAIAYFWTLQLRVTGQPGWFVYDESEGMDVVLLKDDGQS